MGTVAVAAGAEVHSAELGRPGSESLSARLAHARSEAEHHSLRVWRGVEEYRAGDFARAELAVRAYWQAWNRWMQQSAAHNKATADHLARVAETLASSARVLACSFPVDAVAVFEAARDADLDNPGSESRAGVVGGGLLTDGRAASADASNPRSAASVGMLDALRELGTGGPGTQHSTHSDDSSQGGAEGRAALRKPSTLFRAAYAASDLSGSQVASKLQVFASRLRGEALEHTLAAAAAGYKKQCEAVSRDAEGLLSMLHGAAEEVNAAWVRMADTFGAKLPASTAADRERR